MSTVCHCRPAPGPLAMSCTVGSWAHSFATWWALSFGFGRRAVFQPLFQRSSSVGRVDRVDRRAMVYRERDEEAPGSALWPSSLCALRCRGPPASWQEEDYGPPHPEDGGYDVAWPAVPHPAPAIHLPRTETQRPSMQRRFPLGPRALMSMRNSLQQLPRLSTTKGRSLKNRECQISPPNFVPPTCK